MRVGLVGVGRLGRPVCANLVGAVYVVTAGDARAELAGMVAEWGARWGGAPAEVAAEAEVLITMLPGTQELREVMLVPAVRWQPCPRCHLDRYDQHLAGRGEASRRGC
jgi:3-hydroxyisobutyrate dehydrogenase